MGSTSVPGLVAKPIVDIVLAVSDSANEAAYVAALEAEGYVLHVREPDWYEHRMLQGAGGDVNLHVFSEGCPEIDRMLVFRDVLRADPVEGDRYAAVKRELAARRWRHLQKLRRRKNGRGGRDPVTRARGEAGDIGAAWILAHQAASGALPSR